MRCTTHNNKNKATGGRETSGGRGHGGVWQGQGGCVEQEEEMGMGKAGAWVSRPWIHQRMSIVLFVAEKNTTIPDFSSAAGNSAATETRIK